MEMSKVYKSFLIKKKNYVSGYQELGLKEALTIK